MSDLIKTYNPANAAALTSEDLLKLQNLTSQEIKELANAYPNMTMSRAYLLIIDNRKPVEKQLPALSSFENLWNLREKNGLRYYVPYRFRDNYKPIPASSSRRSGVVKRTEILDLSEKDLLNLPGFKTHDKEHPAQTVEVTTVKKAAPVKEDAAPEPEPELPKVNLTKDGKPKAKPGRKPKSQTKI